MDRGPCGWLGSLGVGDPLLVQAALVRCMPPKGLQLPIPRVPAINVLHALHHLPGQSC